MRVLQPPRTDTERAARNSRCATAQYENHCLKQLRKTPEQHRKMVRKTVDYARSQGVRVNVYLEDWSNGYRDNPQYVYDYWLAKYCPLLRLCHQRQSIARE